jgi:hypothetical protein
MKFHIEAPLLKLELSAEEWSQLRTAVITSKSKRVSSCFKAAFNWLPPGTNVRQSRRAMRTAGHRSSRRTNLND